MSELEGGLVFSQNIIHAGYGDYDGVAAGDSDGGTGGGGNGWYGDDDSGRHKVTYDDGGARR